MVGMVLALLLVPFSSCSTMPTEATFAQAWDSTNCPPPPPSVAADTKEQTLEARISEALLRAGVARSSAEAVGEQLSAQDIHTVGDLRTVRAIEAEELMADLKKNHVSIGTRSKLWTLMAGQPQVELVVGSTMESQVVQGTQVTSSLQSHHLRRLQAVNESTGISTDALAIVISVIVACIGYLIQAWSARKAEAAEVVLMHEHQVTVASNQREHEKTLVQIRRTGEAAKSCAHWFVIVALCSNVITTHAERWIDSCCRPVRQSLTAYIYARVRFVEFCAESLEANQPETFSEIYTAGGYDLRPMEQRADGSLILHLGDKFETFLDPTRPLQTTHTAPSCNMSTYAATGSCRTVDIALKDQVDVMTKAWVAELPHRILDAIAADLDGALAHAYRGYIRTVRTL